MITLERASEIAFVLGDRDGEKATKPYTWETDLQKECPASSARKIRKLNALFGYAEDMGFWENYEHGYSIAAE